VPCVPALLPPGAPVVPCGLFAPGCPEEPDVPPARDSPALVLGAPPAGLPLEGDALPAVEADPCDGGVGQPCGRGGGAPLPLLPSPCAEPDDGLDGDEVDGEPEGAWLPEPPPELVGELEGIEPDEPPELEGVDELEEPPGLGIEDPEEPPEVDGAGLLEGMDGEGGIVLGIDVELVVTQPPAATAAATSSKVVIPWIRCIRCPLRSRARARQARFALGWIRAAPGGSISASHCYRRRHPQRRLALQPPCRRLRGRTATAR